MALLMIEGWDNWSSTNGPFGFSQETRAPGRFGDGRYQFIEFGNPVVYLPAPASKVIVGCAFRCVGGYAWLMSIGYNGTRQATIQRTANAPGIVMSWNGGSVTSNMNQIYASVWNYIELKATFNATTGTLAARLNGVAIPGIPDQTNINTNAAGTGTGNTVEIGTDGTSWSQTHADDLYICDGTGSVNNDFLGDVRVETLYPNGAGSSTQWTRGGSDSGTNWGQVDEAVVNDDTDYVTASGVNALDLYTMSDLSTLSGTVYGVQTDLRVRKNDSGTRGVAGTLKVGASTADTQTFGAIATSYQFYREMREDKPGGTGWTISDVNSLEFGPKLTV